MKKRVKNIGLITGRVLVFGGAYSNLQALQKLKSIADDLGIPGQQVINTGDVLGYCAQPQECLDLVREWGIYSIAGNVELQIREGLDDCGCNFDEASRCDVLSQQWYPFALANVGAETRKWLQMWPEVLRFQYAGRSVVVLHGSYENTSEFIFKSTPRSLKQHNFEATGADIVLAGHCGLPFSDLLEHKLWLNAGVIGMPANDGTSRVWYMVLEDENGFDFQHRTFGYDHQTTAALMQAKGLPQSYAKTLSSGLWDNCEVLPDQETEAQGVRLGIDKRNS